MEDKEKLIDRVIERMKIDFENGDVTAIEELLLHVSKENLIQYLPEEEWDDFK